MKYGLYVAAAGALTSMHRQDVLSNNLANMNTVGFKPDAVAMKQLPSQRELSGAATPPQELLERLGGVVQANRTVPSMSQGKLIEGGSPYDLAIEGDGFFTFEGGNGPEDPMLGRDGRMTLDESGTLVSAVSGRAVLNTTGLPITVDPSLDVDIDERGQVRQAGEIVASLGFVDLPEGAILRKVGDGLLRMEDGTAAPPVPATGRIHQSRIEASAVDPIATMSKLMSAAKAAQGNIRMMQFHDYLSGQAINTLGRV